MINLVVGSPGHGKTQFVVAKILEMIKENQKLEEKGEQPRNIYCDVEGLKIAEVEPAPDDWRTVPDGSIIIYDEVHYRKEYEYKGNQYTQIEMIKDLTTHRHTNKDLWLITQDSQRIEKGIHRLIDKLYYIKRPASKPDYTNVFEFDKWLANPDAAANRNAKHKKYLDFYRFHFKSEYQNLYTSASDHSSIKFKLPKQLWTFVLIIGAIILFCFFGLSKTKTFDVLKSDKKVESVKKVDLASSPVATISFNTETECRKAENLERQECKDFYDKATKNHTDIVAMNYDPNKPYDVEYKPQYRIVNQPKFSGCMKKGSVYVAYTEQGTILKNVSQSDCKRLLNDGDRPYDYFTERNKLTVQNEKQTQNDYSNIRKVREAEAEQQSKDIYSENLNVKDSRTMVSDQNKFKNYDDTAISSYK